jgi:hypothetical protein
MSDQFKVFLERSNFGQRIDVRFGCLTDSGQNYAKPLVFLKRDEGVLVPPTVSLDITSAQELMDGLWQCGIRPTEGTGSAGSLRATERHLEDMRSLVFKTAPKKG